MEQFDFHSKFLSFEKENNLFELRDDLGTHFWDLIRFDVYINLMWDYRRLPPRTQSFKSKVGLLLKKAASAIRFTQNTKKCDNFFFLASRNRTGRKLFDQNAISIVNQFTETQRFILESYLSADDDTLLGDSIYNFPQQVARRLFKSKSKFDYSSVVSQVQGAFGGNTLSAEALRQLVNNYYSDFQFFTNLFRKHQIKRVFVTQNGIQKGLFAAAKSLGLATYEFQHGIVDEGHLAYNYPIMQYADDSIILPDVIFSLSTFWFKNMYMPGVNLFPIGNDYFSNNIAPVKDGEGAITVVSADVFGIQLTNFLLASLSVGVPGECEIFFKLHPNQYHEKAHFEHEFRNYPKVKIVTNEHTIYTLLELSHTILTIQSTAVYEALQAGRKVVLLKQSSYRRHRNVFSNPYVHLVDNVEELSIALNAPLMPVGKNQDFFSGFNLDLFKQVIDL